MDWNKRSQTQNISGQQKLSSKQKRFLQRASFFLLLVFVVTYFLY